jgi:hypothetical protein
MRRRLILAAILGLSVLFVPIESMTGCDNALSSVFWSPDAVVDRLQHLKGIDSHLDISHLPETFKVFGETSSNMSACTLWRTISCFDDGYPLVFPRNFPTNPCALEVGSFAAEFTLTGEVVNVTISVTSRQLSELQIGPNLMNKAHSVSIKAVVSFSSAYLGISLVSLAIQGTWKLKEFVIPFQASWLKSKIKLSLSDTLGLLSSSPSLTSDLIRRIMDMAVDDNGVIQISDGSGAKMTVKATAGNRIVLRGEQTIEVAGLVSNLTSIRLALGSLVKSAPQSVKDRVTDTNVSAPIEEFEIISTEGEMRSTSRAAVVDSTFGLVNHATRIKEESHTSKTAEDAPTTAAEGEAKMVRRSRSSRTSIFDAIKGMTLDFLNDSVVVLVSELNSSSVNVSQLLKKYTDIDISKFPPIQQLSTFRSILVNSSATLTPKTIVDIGIDPLAARCGDINEGLSAIISINLTVSSPTIFLIRWEPKVEVKLCQHGFSSFSPLTLMTAIFPSTVLPLTSFLQNRLFRPLGIETLEPVHVNYVVDKNLVVFKYQVDKVIELVPGLAQISVVDFSIGISLDGQRKPSFKANVTWNLGQFTWQDVPYTLNETEGELMWTGSRINLGEVLQKLNATLLPSDYSTFLERANSFDMVLVRPLIRLTLNGRSSIFRLHLAATAMFNRWVNVTVEGIIEYNYSRYKRRSDWPLETVNYPMAIGVAIEGTTVSNVLETLFGGTSLRNEIILKSRTTVMLSLSSIDMPDTTFSNSFPSLLRPRQGIFLYSKFTFPDCSADSLCQVAKTSSNSYLILNGWSTTPCSFTLIGILRTVSFGSITVRNAILILEITQMCDSNPQHKLEIRGNVDIIYGGHTMGFSVNITKTTTSLQMVAIMPDWHYGVYLPFLHVGEGYAHLMSHHPETVKLFEAKVNLTIGLDRCRKNEANILRASAIISLNFLNQYVLGRSLSSGDVWQGRVDFAYDPQNRDTYIHGKINVYTLGSLLRALLSEPLNLLCNLPIPILDGILFPSGFTLIYSSSEVDKRISVLGNLLTFPTGVTGYCKIQFLGISGVLEYRNSGSGSHVEASLSPLHVAGGLMGVYKSSSDRSKGPSLTIGLSSFRVSINGYVEILRVLSTSVEFTVTDKEISAEVKTDMFLFQFSLRIFGTIGPSLSDIDFGVEAAMETGGLQKIGEGVAGVLRTVADKATSFIESLQRKVNDAKAALDKAKRWLDDKKKIFDNAKRKFEGPERALDSAQRKVDGLCSISDCNTWCVGCPGWNGCCTKVWGVCVGCPTWQSCCAKVTDPICATANGLCFGLRAAAYLALELAKKAYTVVYLPFEAAKLALDAAKVAVDVVKIAFDAAYALLEAGKQTVKIGLNLAADIIEFVSSKIVDIKTIEFSASISALSRASVKARVVVVLFGGRHDLKLSLSLNLNDIVNALVENLKPGALKIFRGKRNVDVTLQGSNASQSTLQPWADIDEVNNTVRVRVDKKWNGSAEVNRALNASKLNVTDELDRLVKGRIKSRQEIVHPLAKAAHASNIHWNLFAFLSTSTPNLTVASGNVNDTQDNVVKQDQCNGLKELDEVIGHLSETLVSRYVKWKDSFTQYSKQANRHLFAIQKMEKLRINMKQTAEREERDADNPNERSPLEDELKAELIEEDLLIQEMEKELLRCDKSFRSQLLQYNKIGTKLILRELNTGLYKTTGSTLRQHLDKKLKHLEDNSIVRKIKVISRNLEKMPLRKAATLIETLKNDFKKWLFNMNCIAKP